MSRRSHRKSGIKKHPLATRQRLERDSEILRKLLRARRDGLPLLTTAKDAHEPLAVYGYLPFPILYQSNGQRMPRWDELTSWMKVQLCILVFSEWKKSFQTFTIHLHPKKEAEWIGEKRDIRATIRDRLRRELDRTLGSGREFLFVIEGLSKRGKMPTFLHLHGGVMVRDPSEGPQAILAAERAAGQGIKGYPKLPRATKSEAFYGGDDTWGNYILKFVAIKDERLAERRLAMSQSAIGAGKEFWDLITGRIKEVSLRTLKAEGELL